MLARTVLAATLVACAGACSPGAPPAAPDSDPSSPRARAGVVPPLASAAPEVHAATYVCPMHPDVTSPEPGACPRCHMTLVPAR